MQSSEDGGYAELGGGRGREARRRAGMRSSDGEPGGVATRWRRRRRGNAVAVAAASGPRGKEAGRVTRGRREEEGRRVTLDSERFQGIDLGIFGQLFT